MEKSEKTIFLLVLLLSIKAYSQKLPPLGGLPIFYNGGFVAEADLRVNAGGVFSPSVELYPSGDGLYIIRINKSQTHY